MAKEKDLDVLLDHLDGMYFKGSEKQRSDLAFMNTRAHFEMNPRPQIALENLLSLSHRFDFTISCPPFQHQFSLKRRRLQIDT